VKPIHNSTRRWLLAAIAAVALTPATVRAQPEFRARVKVIEQEAPAPTEGEGGEDGEAKPPTKPPPIIRALVDIDIPGLTAEKFELRDAADETIVVDANSVVTFNESDEPMALVVLVQGNFRWMGNEQYADPDDPETGAIYNGAHIGLGPAIDALAKAGPESSRAALLVYTDGKAIVRQPMGPARSMTAASLGPQTDFKEYISKPLLVGLTESWKILSNEPNSRRVLVVIGDGNDDNEDIAGELRKVITDLDKAEVEVYSIYYTAVAEDGPQGRQNMKAIGSARDNVATSRENFKAYAESIVEFIGARYYVDFTAPLAYEPGSSHEVTVAIKRNEGEPLVSDPQLIELPKDFVRVIPEKKSYWWVWVILGAVILILLVIIIKAIRARRRRQPVYEPEPVFEEAAPDSPSRHTVMLGVGGTAESMPVVGWIVPLNGPNQYQTFKLLQGTTKIGTGATSHIVLNDEFMTLEHCEIISSPSGFVLNDLGATNGTYLNRMRVSSHDLVDNDVIRLGKTELQFKSIN